jgi:hypothetical protein
VNLTEVTSTVDGDINLCRLQLRDLANVEPDDAWCLRFDRVVDDVRAALRRCAADPDRRGPLRNSPRS